MKFKDRSLKSKEKFADSLMSLSNIILGAAAVGIFVFPLTAYISAVFSGLEPFSFLLILDHMSWPKVWLFTFVYFLPLIVGFCAKQKAMNIYDQIEKLAPTRRSSGTPQKRGAP